MPQTPKDAALGEADPVLDLGLVLRPAWPGRQDADAVVRGHHPVAAVQLGIVERGLVHARLQVVDHDQAGHAAEEAEHPDVRANPVWQGLGPGRLGIGEVRGAEHGDEDLRLAHLAGVRIGDRDLLAGIVDEDLVAGIVILPHARRQPALEAAEQLAEATVAVPVGLDRPVFFPEHHHGDAGLLQIDDQLGPVGLRAAAEARLDPGPGEQPGLEGIVGEIARQRPAQPHVRGARQVLLNGAAGHAQHACDLAAAGAVPGQTQHLAQLSHGQLPLRRHPVPPSRSTGGRMPELLTQEPSGLRPGGRLHVGMVAGFIPERWPASNRKTRPD